jgi:hypothetical protein
MSMLLLSVKKNSTFVTSIAMDGNKIAPKGTFG